jgi:hypothetical protein
MNGVVEICYVGGKFETLKRCDIQIFYVLMKNIGQLRIVALEPFEWLKPPPRCWGYPYFLPKIGLQNGFPKSA